MVLSADLTGYMDMLLLSEVSTDRFLPNILVCLSSDGSGGSELQTTEFVP